jgi:hypothetical protein
MFSLGNANANRSRAILSFLSILAMIAGAVFAFLGNEKRGPLEACLSQSQCYYQQGQLYLESALDAARAEIDFGVALIVMGVFVFLYLFFTEKRSKN